MLPAKNFSEQENRALATIPRISLERLASGKLFEDISSFYSDQIPLRTQMIKAKAYLELALGKQQNNSVLFLSNGHLIDRCEYQSTAALFENLSLIKDFSENRGGISCQIVPRSVDIYTDSDSARSLTDRVYSLMGDSLLFDSLLQANAEGQDVYYKTDHHLTAQGAYILYCNILSSFDMQPYSSSQFNPQIFSNDFLGSIYSKAGLICESADTITLYRYDSDGKYTVSCLDHGCTLDSIYDFSAAAQKDKYQVFTGGNHGVLQISSANECRPQLLLIKDSFANAVIPLLARHFDITVYDPRYATDNVPRADDFDLVCIVMGIDTLAKM